MDDVQGQFARWRKLMQLTQQELSRLLGVDVKSVGRMERGETPISKSTLIHLEMLFKRCYLPADLDTLIEVVGQQRVYLGKSWMHLEKPRWQHLLIKSKEEPGYVATLVFDALAEHHVLAAEASVYSTEEIAGSVFSGYFQHFEEKLPAGWKRHQVR